MWVGFTNLAKWFEHSHKCGCGIVMMVCRQFLGRARIP